MGSTGTDQSFIARPTIFIQWTHGGSPTPLAAVRRSDQNHELNSCHEYLILGKS